MDRGFLYEFPIHFHSKSEYNFQESSSLISIFKFHLVGIVLEGLETSGASNTIVFLWSAHGFHLG